MTCLIYICIAFVYDKICINKFLANIFSYLFFPFLRFKCQNLINWFVVFTFNSWTVYCFHPKTKNIINGFIYSYTRIEKIEFTRTKYCPKGTLVYFPEMSFLTLRTFFNIFYEIKSLGLKLRLLFMGYRYLHE